MIQDWANDNTGSIELSGNLAAVGQRHLAIQNQIEQITALKSLAEAQRRQQIENALLEERQNILYDISAALADIKAALTREPAKAYFDFLVLEEFVSSLGLEHRLFPDLEWKNHCNKTLAGLGDLRAWCDTSLDIKSRQSGENALAQHKSSIEHAQKTKKVRLFYEQQQRQLEIAAGQEKKELSKLRIAIGFAFFFGFISVLSIVSINGENIFFAFVTASTMGLAIFCIAIAIGSWSNVQAARKKLAK